MKPLIKICGITNLIDAKNSLNNGSDYIGLINIRESYRYVSELEISQLVLQLNNQEKNKVVLLTDLSNVDEIIRLASSSNLKIIQPYSKNLKREALMKMRSLGFQIFMPFLVESSEDIEEINLYKGFVDLLILDNKPKISNQLGGSGESFDWNIYKKIAASTDIPLGLAGGLSPENIVEAIKFCKPYLVDASSKLESSPGLKSLEKLKSFINKVNETSQEDLKV